MTTCHTRSELACRYGRLCHGCPARRYISGMQTIINANASPETYAREDRHTRVCSPQCCPACGQGNGLKAHGYYQRYTTDASGKPIALRVRRFKCRNCATTVSCLPNFAQPYRLVNCETIQRSFNGDTDSGDVQRNLILLRRYWQMFMRWCRQLHRLFIFMMDAGSGKKEAGEVWRLPALS